MAQTTVPNAGTWPGSGISRTRVLVDNRMLEIALDWDEIRRMAAGALGNKTGRVKRGPVIVREVRP